MKKMLLLLVMLFVTLTCAIPASASDVPAIYKETITVTQDGGRYQVGFVNLEFKKGFLDPGMLPATFEVTVYAENGKACIQFSPDTPQFFKKVHIRASAYSGLLYDVSAGQNINVSVKRQQVLAEHFSHYCFNR